MPSKRLQTHGADIRTGSSVPLPQLTCLCLSLLAKRCTSLASHGAKLPAGTKHSKACPLNIKGSRIPLLQPLCPLPQTQDPWVSRASGLQQHGLVAMLNGPQEDSLQPATSTPKPRGLGSRVSSFHFLFHNPNITPTLTPI